ncbi:MAG TPA: hypothetical protein VMH86_09280 [Rhizomicrobium sp.]|nr:hypothetical protein [Rhizomicrobium sp.]
MSARVGLILALMCASGAAWAQGAPKPKPVPAVARMEAPADATARFEAQFAVVAARGAWTGDRAPSREELLNVLLVMSLRDGRGHGA